MATVIKADGLSKRYTIGNAVGGYSRLTEDITDAAARLLRRRPGERVEKTSRELWALDDVSLEIEEGEVVGVIGRNGAGKTTLLKVMARITEPTRGRAVVMGRVGSLLEVGTGFHPELTGRENVFLNGAILGMRRSEIRQKFDDIVSFADVERFIDTPVKRYSSGMYVRLAFAVAAFLDPEILFIDEVLSVGDQEFQQRCIGRMGEIARSGRTILFVSHNLASGRPCAPARSSWMGEDWLGTARCRMSSISTSPPCRHSQGMTSNTGSIARETAACVSSASMSSVRTEGRRGPEPTPW